MMFKRVLVLYSFVLITQINSFTHVNLQAFIDDAKALLQNLNDLALGNILVAHDQINDLGSNLDGFSADVIFKSELDIQEENQAVNEEIANFKSLAEAVNKNISECLNGNEKKLTELPEIYRKQVKECIADVQKESNSMLSQAFYNVDILMNHVHDLSFQLGQCLEDDNECISAVVDKINNAIENIPLKIKAEVNTANEEVELSQAKIQQCADLGVAGYVEGVTDIMNDVTVCVNEIISSFM
ncbi:uncharacterized protein LOC123007104 [Tribolium madens]|uniref:uncharacterized protein LOC123007104 n=1 Tax=Tribolium madens TaxID=41895 RepID=UPI001CF759BA|nr:uncharacterized protein LOC123007104 [Tribolium madens]